PPERAHASPHRAESEHRRGDATDRDRPVEERVRAISHLSEPPEHHLRELAVVAIDVMDGRERVSGVDHVEPQPVQRRRSGESASPSAAQNAASGSRMRRASTYSNHTPRSPQPSDSARAAATRAPSSRMSPPTSVRWSGPYWYVSRKPRHTCGCCAHRSAI